MFYRSNLWVGAKMLSDRVVSIDRDGITNILQAPFKYLIYMCWM